PIKFAGFWKRVIATIIDGLIILFSGLILYLILVYGFGLTFAALFVFPPFAGEGVVAEFIGRHIGHLVWFFVFILVLWLYYAIMESSRCQGTLGKMLLGIYITNQYGKRIGVGQASGRYFLKVLLYSVPLLGFIDCVMVAVTEKKQAWHDMPVGCLVLSK
ncbi:MAG: RDD family protein, partial [Planctomycetes bacterium]|nr:RDD family protein [Planctomycetota bacterium]